MFNFSNKEENEKAKKSLVEDDGYPEPLVQLIGLYNHEKSKSSPNKEFLNRLEEAIKKGIQFLISKAVAPIVAINGFDKDTVDNMATRYTDMVFQEIERLKKIQNLNGNN